MFKFFLIITGLTSLAVLSAFSGYYLATQPHQVFQHKSVVTLTLQKLPKTYVTALRAGSCSRE